MKLKNNIESVRLGWEDLRMALGKELVLNLDSQILELQNLAYVTAQLKAGELRDRGDIFTPSNIRKFGFDKVYSYDDLSKELKPKQPILIGRAAAFEITPRANPLDFFTAIAQANAATGGKDSAETIQNLASSITNGAINLPDMSQEVAKKELPKLRENINKFNTLIGLPAFLIFSIIQSQLTACSGNNPVCLNPIGFILKVKSLYLICQFSGTFLLYFHPPPPEELLLYLAFAVFHFSGKVFSFHII